MNADSHHLTSRSIFPSRKLKVRCSRDVDLFRPILRASALDAADVVRNSRYAKVGDEMFYRRAADAGSNVTALVFASEKQLEVLKLSTQVYCDATFKIVPKMYYQLFIIFVPHADATFPVFYALMSRKMRDLYYAIFHENT